LNESGLDSRVDAEENPVDCGWSRTRENPNGKVCSTPRRLVREQVELYESSGGTEGTTLLDTGLPVIIVTHIGNKTGAIRKAPLMRVKDGNSYVLVGSQGGAPEDPAWVHNLRINPDVRIRDNTVVEPMLVREVEDEPERSRLWKLAVAAYPPYAEYQDRTARRIRVFVAERA
jgi:deazaflavin-dependent oxidoreductase (nitroreductase family)